MKWLRFYVAAMLVSLILCAVSIFCAGYSIHMYEQTSSWYWGPLVFVGIIVALMSALCSINLVDDAIDEYVDKRSRS